MRLLLCAFALFALPASAPAPPPAAAHNFHVSYGKMAVQGRAATLMVRFFRDDLEKTLADATGAPSYDMKADTDVETQFLAYFQQHLVIEAGGVALVPRIIGSGEQEKMWWYRLRYDAPVELATFTVRNTLLFDTFEDQRNIVNVMRFPEEKTETLYFTDGAEAFTVRF